jgi:uracil-DNA glycosylase
VTVPDNRLREPLARSFEQVPAAWRGVTDAFLSSATGRALVAFVDQRVGEGASVFPASVFRALELTPLPQVRVVVLGQDPYHRAGQAQGLAFSVAAGQRVLPPSLRNILAEVRHNTGDRAASRDDLGDWARQGVLLLNSVLTVEEGRPQSHAGRGWEALTDAVISAVARRASPTVFMLWGASAQRKRSLIDAVRADSSHLVLTANHPSPLSARRPPAPFLGCRHFTRANAFLTDCCDAGGVRW